MRTHENKAVKRFQKDKCHRLGIVLTLSLLVLSGTLFLINGEAINMKLKLNQSNEPMLLLPIAKLLLTLACVLFVLLEIRLFFKHRKGA